jgi:hypothetical protein
MKRKERSDLVSRRRKDFSYLKSTSRLIRFKKKLKSSKISSSKKQMLESTREKREIVKSYKKQISLYFSKNLVSKTWHKSQLVWVVWSHLELKTTTKTFYKT